MRRLIAIVAFVGFALSIAVHGATFLGVDLMEKSPLVWGLHFGIFPLAILMALTIRVEEKDFYGFFRKFSTWKGFVGPMPPWAKYVVYFLLAYDFINFGLFFFLSGGGTPELRDGKYVLHDHGRIIKELTEQQYHLQNAYILRLFSGAWMFFYIIYGLYFWFPKQKQMTDEL
jgi:hypothetical protein